MRLGDSRLQFLIFEGRMDARCDLRLGDSRLQSLANDDGTDNSCDLRLGDSRLQLPMHPLTMDLKL